MAQFSLNVGQNSDFDVRCYMAFPFHFTGVKNQNDIFVKGMKDRKTCFHLFRLDLQFLRQPLFDDAKHYGRITQ